MTEKGSKMLLLLICFAWLVSLGIVCITALFLNGTFTLPGTNQRRIQAAKAEAQIQEFNAEKEDALRRVEQLSFAREAERIRFNYLLDEAIEKKQLERGSK
jgi:flagellar basal body-associated protein FliL